MSTTALDLSLPSDEPIIEFSRFVKAPPALVFEVWTRPEHLPHWWGPRELTLEVFELDAKVGGRYRFVHRSPDGQVFAFHGEYLELDPPRRIVNSFVYEGMPDATAIETITLEAVDGGTMIHQSVRHGSLEARDAHVASGMEYGMTESFIRMDELVALLQ
jgi:uncharacterized protein YndB with AHSA1/START domain